MALTGRTDVIGPCLVTLLVAIASISSIVMAQDVADSDFLRRGEMSVSVLGDHLYIEGGEVARKFDGVIQDNPAKPVNNTYSIPLNSAWTNKTVSLKETSSNETLSPVKFFSLWSDDRGKTPKMYRWGGEGPQKKIYEDARDPRLGIFTPDGTGGGSWAAEDLSRPRSIARVTGASSTSCNGVGFSLGGWGNPGTDRLSFQDNVPVPGLITYDMETRAWANESALPFSQHGTHAWGSAVCIPSLGSSSSSSSSNSKSNKSSNHASSPSGRLGGLVFFLGGESTGPTFPDHKVDANEPLSFAKIVFYDHAAKKWHSQTATGDVPAPRRRFCAVTVSSPGSHEIVMYGGANPLQTGREQGFGDVHVLTLPGFRWFKIQGAAAARRQGHACAAVPGKRVMISVGGWDDKFDVTEAWTTADPWTKGIGVLDLSLLRWLDRYDPAAAAYESPAVVRDWYRDGRLATVKWDSEDTKTLFSVRDAAPGTGTGKGSKGKKNGGGDSGIDVGTVAVGVVGGVTFVGIAAAVAFFLLRQRERKGHHLPQELPDDEGPARDVFIKHTDDSLGESSQSPPKSHHELLSPNRVSELSSPTGLSEVPGDRMVYEMDGQDQRDEMDGQDQRDELDGQDQRDELDKR